MENGLCAGNKAKYMAIANLIMFTTFLMSFQLCSQGTQYRWWNLLPQLCSQRKISLPGFAAKYYVPYPTPVQIWAVVRAGHKPTRTLYLCTHFFPVRPPRERDIPPLAIFHLLSYQRAMWPQHYPTAQYQHAMQLGSQLGQFVSTYIHMARHHHGSKQLRRH